MACWASGEQAAAASDEPMAPTTAGPEPSRRAGVVDLLASIAAGHPEPLCREAAVAALGAIGDEAGLPAVLAACHDRPAVRRRAVIALAPSTGRSVDAARSASRHRP